MRILASEIVITATVTSCCTTRGRLERIMTSKLGHGDGHAISDGQRLPDEELYADREEWGVVERSFRESVMAISSSSKREQRLATLNLHVGERDAGDIRALRGNKWYIVVSENSGCLPVSRRRA